MLTFFSAFFGKMRIFSFFLEKQLLAFSVIVHDCDPDFSTQKDASYLCVEIVFLLYMRYSHILLGILSSHVW